MINKIYKLHISKHDRNYRTWPLNKTLSSSLAFCWKLLEIDLNCKQKKIYCREKVRKLNTSFF